jgi:hypothetical protein
MKKLIKGAFFLALIGTVIVGCEKEEMEITEANASVMKNKGTTQKSADNLIFSFDTYDRFQDEVYLADITNISDNLTRLEANNIILADVNTNYQTSIDYDNSLKSIDLNSKTEISQWLLNNTQYNAVDIGFLEKFSDNLVKSDIDAAVSILQSDLNDANISSSKFANYESLVNTIKLIEFQSPGTFTIDNGQKSWGCAWAFAKVGLAAASMVVGCSPPAAGASVGVSCYLGATAFVAASASLGSSC